MDFKVVLLLAVPVILGCNCFDEQVEAIKQRKRIAELDDGTTGPIFRKPLTCPAGAVPLTKQQKCIPSNRRSSENVQVTTKTTLQPESHNWVTVLTDGEGLVTIKPQDGLYERH